MNRKDFEALAKALKGAKPVGPSDSALYAGGWRMTAIAIAREVTTGEARTKFLKACGVVDGHAAP